MPKLDTTSYIQGRLKATRTDVIEIPVSRGMNDTEYFLEGHKRLPTKIRSEDTHGRIVSELWLPTRKKVDLSSDKGVLW